VLECHAGSQLRFTATRPEAAGCSESLHFVRLAISARLCTSSPRPTCTADSSAALTATAPVRSCACLAMFCTSATFTAAAFPSHSPPCHVLFTTRISSLAFLPHLSLYPLSLTCFPDSVVPFWHVDTELECLPLLRLPLWRCCWKRLVLYFLKSPKTIQSESFDFGIQVTHARSGNSTRARTNNRIISGPT
jgi:hypothetical protein